MDGMQFGQDRSKYEIYLRFSEWMIWCTERRQRWNQNLHRFQVFVWKIECWWLNKQADGLKVEEREEHRNPLTRKTACDSQELILLIAQSYLITVWSRGILCADETFFTAKQIRHISITACVVSSKQIYFTFFVGQGYNRNKSEERIRQKKTWSITDFLIDWLKRGHSSRWPHTNKERNLATSVWKRTETKTQVTD